MKVSLRRFVWARAHGRCEYCLIHQDHDELPHHLDHIIAVKHRGPTAESNLALACANCSLGKGSNIAGTDTRSGKMVRLFHPRLDVWERHFRWSGPRLRGITAIGRATIAVLNINQADRVALRTELIAQGVFPPAIESEGP
jgi:hypothetical protein